MCTLICWKCLSVLEIGSVAVRIVSIHYLKRKHPSLAQWYHVDLTRSNSSWHRYNKRTVHVRIGQARNWQCVAWSRKPSIWDGLQLTKREPTLCSNETPWPLLMCYGWTMSHDWSERDIVKNLFHPKLHGLRNNVLISELHCCLRQARTKRGDV